MRHLKKVHIPAGDFIIDKSKPLIVQAYLSSCIGVALYDKKNNIGGLSHYLLPAPVSKSAVATPGKYASTGLPIFLNNLISMGASIDNLTACIAGGAFSGSLSQQDINLDIGGRTAETVRSFLLQKGIKNVSSETGGFFTCCLNLNMSTWQTEIVPSYPEDHDENNIRKIPTVKTIESTLDKIQPIPQVALKILRMINDDDSNVTDLSSEVRKDQIISAQVLKYCNSAVFSGRGAIDSIDDALLIIGQVNLAKIITSIAVKNLFKNHNEGYSLVKGGLYHHAIGVALVSEKLAVKTEMAHHFAAYTAGLLHDIGKIALDQFVSCVAPLFYRDLNKTPNSSIEIENKYLNTDHTKIGHRLAEMWTLPETVKDVILHHHTPEKSQSKHKTTIIVAVADMLLHMFNAGPKLSKVNPTDFNDNLNAIGLKITDFPELIDLIPVSILTSSPEHIL